MDEAVSVLTPSPPPANVSLRGNHRGGVRVAGWPNCISILSNVGLSLKPTLIFRFFSLTVIVSIAII